MAKLPRLTQPSSIHMAIAAMNQTASPSRDDRILETIEDVVDAVFMGEK